MVAIHTSQLQVPVDPIFSSTAAITSDLTLICLQICFVLNECLEGAESTVTALTELLIMWQTWKRQMTLGFIASKLYVNSFFDAPC